jgi:tetratricopeptide (TPR) repeat protein
MKYLIFVFLFVCSLPVFSQEPVEVIIARELEKSSKYQEAIDKYNEYLSRSVRTRTMMQDQSQDAAYYLEVSMIYFRKLDSFEMARSNALKAAELDPTWGKPYMVIGDLYVRTAQLQANQYDYGLNMLAAIDKYNKALELEPGLVEEIQPRIDKYSKRFPSSEGALHKEGETVLVPGWVKERVVVKYRK